MGYSIKPNRNIKASMFTVVGIVGAMGAVIAVGGELIFQNPDYAKLGRILAFLSLVALMPSKNKDEFYSSLWNTGASWALISVVVWTMLAPFLAGVYDGVMGYERSPRVPQGAVFTVLATGFFAGFNWRRLGGAA